MSDSDCSRPSEPNSVATHTIRQLNDVFRQTFTGGTVLLTPGIQSAGGDHLSELLIRIRTFAAFSEDNDPNHEHDFGGLEWRGEKVFWKIDYYDQDLQYHSPDPADASITTRVLTIMLAREY